MLKYAVKNIIYRMGYVAGYQKLLLNRIKKNNWVTILSLHRISPQIDKAWPPLSPKIFDLLMTFLKKHFEITTLHELENIKSLKPKLVISFDDGYYDFLEYAMPVLRKHQIKVNLNIIPSQLLGERPLWNIALYDFINAAPDSLLKNFNITGWNHNILKGKINKTKLALKASQILKKLPIHERNLIINGLERNLYSQLSTYPKTRMLQLNEMPQILSEHEIGAHSYSHNSMGDIDMKYFIDDFLQCKNFFIKHQFPKMDIYAFPNGSYREEQVTYLKKNGIKYILFVGEKYAHLQSPYYRFNIAAFNQYEAIFQSLGMKHR